jgi:hypothetical protein
MSTIDSAWEYDIDGDDGWVDESWVDEGWPDESAGRGEVLRAVLHDDFADASPEDLDDAWESVLDQLSPAEGLSFSRALSGARALLANPAVIGAVKSGLPIAAGALGTVVGGPAGTVLASKLGSTVAKALPGPTGVRPAAAAAVAAPASVAAGSRAAIQAIHALDHPLINQALGSLAFGAAGPSAVGSVNVTDIAKMLNAIFNQVAADADELSYSRGAEDGEDLGYVEDSIDDTGRALYEALVDLDNAELAEEWE